MEIGLRPGAESVRVKVRRYAPAQRKFLRENVDEFQRLGLIRADNTSSWACAPLIIPKTGPEKYRLTIDLRLVNRQTVKTSWPMLNMDSAATELAGDSCFAVIGLCQGYWQLQLHPNSQECQSFITLDGVYSPTRILRGQSNSAPFFQSTLQMIFGPIQDKIPQWLHGLLLHCKSVQELLDILRQLFDICNKYGVKLHTRKCRFYMEVVKWCRRLISKEDIKLDPAITSSLISMPRSKTGRELQQFVRAVNWMRSCIPQYNIRRGALSDLRENVYKKAKGRSKTHAGRVKLSADVWTNSAHNRVKYAIKKALTLSHPDAKKSLRPFTDASDTNWAGVLT